MQAGGFGQFTAPRKKRFQTDESEPAFKKVFRLRPCDSFKDNLYWVNACPLWIGFSAIIQNARKIHLFSYYVILFDPE